MDIGDSVGSESLRRSIGGLPICGSGSQYCLLSSGGVGGCLQELGARVLAAGVASCRAVSLCLTSPICSSGWCGLFFWLAWPEIVLQTEVVYICAGHICPRSRCEGIEVS